MEILKSRRAGTEDQKLQRPQEAGRRLILTEEQTSRLLGISHLEGGMDPLLIIDELLQRDTKLRAYRLSLKKTRVLSDFLDAAMERGWTIELLLDVVECLYFYDIQTLPIRTVLNLITLLRTLKESKWEPSKFVQDVRRLLI